jgi:RNA polymerase sigma-70 factor (ECF subfamily)
MSVDSAFDELIRRVRAGDPRAAEELVRQYEPVVRLEVRMRLGDPRLGRLFDSMDVCQSVMASFFVRAAAGQYDLEEPRQLVGLLVGMARNKLAFQVRKHRRQRRDARRNEPLGEAAHTVAARGPSPSEIVVGRELLERFRQELSEEERALADRRAGGLGWVEIAAELGGTAQGRRKQLERAIDRVVEHLGLND